MQGVVRYGLKDEGRRQALRGMLYEPHIKPISDLVRRLRRETGTNVPFVDPRCGGTGSLVLFLLQDPGSGAKVSEFLSLENPDPTAANGIRFIGEAGMTYDRIAFWNIVPWPDGPLDRTEIERGGRVLAELLDLLPNLRSLILAGNKAQNGFRNSGARLPAQVRTFASPHWSPVGLGLGARYEPVPHIQRELARAWDYAIGRAG